MIFLTPLLYWMRSHPLFHKMLLCLCLASGLMVQKQSLAGTLGALVLFLACTLPVLFVYQAVLGSLIDRRSFASREGNWIRRRLQQHTVVFYSIPPLAVIMRFSGAAAVYSVIGVFILYAVLSAAVVRKRVGISMLYTCASVIGSAALVALISFLLVFGIASAAF